MDDGGDATLLRTALPFKYDGSGKFTMNFACVMAAQIVVRLDRAVLRSDIAAEGLVPAWLRRTNTAAEHHLCAGAPGRPGCRKPDCQFVARRQGEVLARRSMVLARSGLSCRPTTSQTNLCCVAIP